MDRTRLTQQTSTTRRAPRRAGPRRPVAPGAARRHLPRPAAVGARGPRLGHRAARPSTSCCCALAVVIALGGVDATLHVDGVRAPLLALPFAGAAAVLPARRSTARGCARWSSTASCRCSAASRSAAMAVAVLGMLLNHAGARPERLAARLAASRSSASASGASLLVLAQRWARARAAGRQARR